MESTQNNQDKPSGSQKIPKGLPEDANTDDTPENNKKMQEQAEWRDHAEDLENNDLRNQQDENQTS